MLALRLAAALRLNGDDVQADQALESLYATYPDLRERLEAIVTSQRLPPKIVEMIFGA